MIPAGLAFDQQLRAPRHLGDEPTHAEGGADQRGACAQLRRCVDDERTASVRPALRAAAEIDHLFSLLHPTRRDDVIGIGDRELHLRGRRSDMGDVHGLVGEMQEPIAKLLRRVVFGLGMWTEQRRFDGVSAIEPRAVEALGAAQHDVFAIDARGRRSRDGAGAPKRLTGRLAAAPEPVGLGCERVRRFVRLARRGGGGDRQKQVGMRHGRGVD